MSASGNPADDALFEIVESDRLVFFTGAGFSADLLNSSGDRFPSWVVLLQAVRRLRERQGNLPRRNDLLDLFLDAQADGPTLVEAASILREDFEDEFDEAVSRHLSPAPDDEQPPAQLEAHVAKQELLLRLRPRGIVTVNVDPLHERHLERTGRLDQWNVADALADDGEARIRNALLEIDDKPFLLKAHGTCGNRLAVDFDTYRRLLAELPIYRAFMVNLFMDYRIVFVGFGLSDLDFDFLLQSQALALGAPIRQHVALFLNTPGDAGRQRRAAVLEHRAGVLCRWYEEHSEWPGILEQAAVTPGTRLRGVLEECLHRDHQVRSEAHHKLANLGPAGKHVAASWIMDEIDALSDAAGDAFRFSELVYTLGKLDPPFADDRKRIQALLMDVLRKAAQKEVLAHAILALDPFTDITDLPSLEALLADKFPDPPVDIRSSANLDDRVPVYLQSLMYKLKARARS